MATNVKIPRFLEKILNYYAVLIMGLGFIVIAMVSFPYSKFWKVFAAQGNQVETARAYVLITNTSDVEETFKLEIGYHKCPEMCGRKGPKGGGCGICDSDTNHYCWGEGGESWLEERTVTVQPMSSEQIVAETETYECGSAQVDITVIPEHDNNFSLSCKECSSPSECGGKCDPGNSVDSYGGPGGGAAWLSCGPTIFVDYQGKRIGPYWAYADTGRDDCEQPPAECGDGVIDPGEDCDPPGNTDQCEHGACTSSCKCPQPPPPQPKTCGQTGCDGVGCSDGTECINNRCGRRCATGDIAYDPATDCGCPGEISGRVTCCESYNPTTGQCDNQNDEWYVEGAVVRLNWLTSTKGDPQITSTTNQYGRWIGSYELAAGQVYMMQIRSDAQLINLGDGSRQDVPEEMLTSQVYLAGRDCAQGYTTPCGGTSPCSTVDDFRCSNGGAGHPSPWRYYSGFYPWAVMGDTARTMATFSFIFTVCDVPPPRPERGFEIEKIVQGSHYYMPGDEITFNVEIRNIGQVVIDQMTFIDRYDASYLRFLDISGSRMRNGEIIVSTNLRHVTYPSVPAGELRISNLADHLGDLGVGEEYVITVRFRALRAVERTENVAIGDDGVGQHEDSDWISIGSPPPPPPTDR